MERPDKPNDPLELLLSNVTGYLAVDLSCVERHGQSLRHVFLYGGGYVRVLVRRSHPNFGRSFVLELALTQLAQLRNGDERQDHVGGKSFLDSRLDSQRVRRIHKNAGMLGCNDRVYHCCQVVDIGERLDTEDDIVKWTLSSSSRLFRDSHD